ncbi:MAG: alanine racemase [Thermodesulfobacteriota bacterium]
MERRFNVVKVDLSALAHNLGEVRRLVGSGVKIMAVVKADAYGHGLTRVGRHLVQNGADALGVLDLDEAVRLRDAGVRIPIYILAGIEPGRCREIIEQGLVPFIYDAGLAREMNEAARRLGVRAAVQLKVDTGMNRLGAPHWRAAEFFREAAGLEHLVVTGLVTHFAEADLKDSLFTQVQLDRFEAALDAARKAGLDSLTLNNAANSAAVLSLPRTHQHMVRPGLMLYGAYPDPHLKNVADLRPAMKMTSRIIQVKSIPPGESVSYGRTWTSARETRIATAPVGYAHGINRLLSNRGCGLIRGRRAPLIGRVCMNLTLFDVTHIPEAAPGDEIVLLGSQDGETISGDEIADLIGTINYEVFCHLGGLNAREYVGE